MYVACFFEKTVSLFEGQKTDIVSMYSFLDAQNSCASDESLLLCFEVFVFPFSLNYSCLFFFEGMDRSISLVADLIVLLN